MVYLLQKFNTNSPCQNNYLPNPRPTQTQFTHAVRNVLLVRNENYDIFEISVLQCAKCQKMWCAN